MLTPHRPLMFVICCLLSFLSHCKALAAPSPQSQLAARLPAVATIEVEHMFIGPQQSTDIPPLNRSFGSAFFIADSGILVTNAHVVRGAQSILVRSHSGNEANADILGLDEVSDLAVLKTSMKPDAFIDLNTKNTVYIGEPVYAIGNAFDLAQSVSYGIVSALNRAINNPLQDFIQTDSAINQGNSGGPLINGQGDLVGVNTMIISTSGGNNGVGFAIPVSIVRNIVEQIISHGSIKPSQLGIHVQNISSDMIKALGGSPRDKGVLVAQIIPETAAEQLTLQPQDIIVTLNEEPIVTASQLAAQIYSMREGTLIKLEVIRQGQRKTLTGLLSAPTHNKPLPTLGLQVKTHESMHDSGTITQGLEVVQIEKNSAAALSGLMKHDVIVRANSKPLQHLKDFALLSQSSDVILEVIRLQKTLFLLLKSQTL